MEQDEEQRREANFIVRPVNSRVIRGKELSNAFVRGNEENNEGEKASIDNELIDGPRSHVRSELDKQMVIYA